MASIQKRGKTYQYTVSRMVDGKPKPIRKGGFRTKKEAIIAGAEVELGLKKGVVYNFESEPFVELFTKWARLYKSKLSNATKLHYNYTSKIIEEYFGNETLKEIGRHDYQMFLNEFGSTKSKETVEKVNGHIRAFAKDAIEEGFLEKDFTRKATITWAVPPKKGNEKHLNYEESKRLLKELYKKVNVGDFESILAYCLILLALNTGMRFAELVGLTKDDFDFENQKIRVEKTWSYLKRGSVGFGPTKNGSSERSIKVDQSTMDVFSEIFNKQNLKSKNKDNLIFFNKSSKYKVITNTYANNVLKKITSELGLNSISFHGLRHTHASILLYKGVSVHYVSERLGHESIETTLRTYSHLVKELREADENRTIEIIKNLNM